MHQNYQLQIYYIVRYGASHLVAELFIGCVDPVSSPKMEMYDQKTNHRKCSAFSDGKSTLCVK